MSPVQSGLHRETETPRVITTDRPVWNQWAPDALESPLAPIALVEAYDRWQPDDLKIRRLAA